MGNREPMLDMFIFETVNQIESLEQIMLDSEKSGQLGLDSVNEIFRIMHTIKGSSAMMLFDNISKLSHAIEDLFYYIREASPQNIDYSKLADIVLRGSDSIKAEIQKIDNDEKADSDFSDFISSVKDFLLDIKGQSPEEVPLHKEESKAAEKETQKYYIGNNKSENNALYSALLRFEEGCEMENIRCFTIVHNLQMEAEVISYKPDDIIENNDSSKIIIEDGFNVIFKSSKTIEQLKDFFSEVMFLKDYDIKALEEKEIKSDNREKIEKEVAKISDIEKKKNEKSIEADSHSYSSKQNMISVDVNKLDILMDLVGELVISESMVTKNSELSGLQLNSFNKAARQLKKRLMDLQDVVMSIRMVPLAGTFNKMNRLVRDMCKKLNKEVDIEIIGQDTEVDKNILEHISDPIMHIIRNAMDHGIEAPEDRENAGKDKKGKITIIAKNAGGEVWIIIKDDGKGLDKEKILNKARENGLVKDTEANYSEKDIYSFILLPGFSTKDKITEFSGRGVGMDVVTKEIEKIRGTVSIDSVKGKGTTISIRIPLTLAIIDGMIIKVGESRYIIPITSIRESFAVKQENVIHDTDGNEMIIIRGNSCSIIRLHQLFNVKTDVHDLSKGILVMLEDGNKNVCVFADELVGEQQVVVKALPEYIKKVKGIAGCTLLGDGNISLILDVGTIVSSK